VDGGPGRPSPTMADLSRTSSIMPLSRRRMPAHDGWVHVPQPLRLVARDRTGPGRRVVRRQRREAHEHDPGRRAPGRPTSATLLVKDPLDPQRFVARSNSVGIRLLSGVLAFSLDRRLASGVHPQSNRLMAARADRLVSPQVRRQLAQNWLDLLGDARRPPTGQCPRVPLCRDRISSAEEVARALAGLLSTSLPVPARGVAMASVLLSDGGGPLYNRHCATDLRAVLWEVSAHLDPMVPLD